MAKGVKSITGNASPEVGEKNFYEVSSFYQGTVIKNENEIKWKLYTQQSSGNWRELRGPQKTGKKVPFSFPEKWLGKKLLIEAFVYNPEVKSPPGLIVTPKTAKIPKINKVELFYVDDKKGSVFSFMEKLRARAYCVNMFLKELTFTLWEDDVKGGGHNTNNKPIRTLKARVDKNGVAVVEFPLSEAYMKKAMEGEVDVKQLEFYVTVEYYKNKKHATKNVDVDNPNPKVPINPPKKTEPKQPPKAKGSPAESKPKSKKEEKGILDKIEEKWDELWDWWETPGTIKKEQLPTQQKPEGRSPAVVQEQPKEKKEEKECTCFCDRDISATELKEMVVAMRKATNDDAGENFYKWNKDNLFTIGHEKFSEKTYEKFAEVLNKTFKNYEITTCIRKIHFLAQCYHETGAFMRSVEGNEKESLWYDPYRGRGFIHLTLKGNYIKFQENSGFNVVANPKLVSTNIEIAAMSSGWYWKFNDKGNINPFADKDSIFDTSRLVNKPNAKSSSSIRGYNQRVNAVNALKNKFEYPQNCCSLSKKEKPKENTTCPSELSSCICSETYPVESGFINHARVIKNHVSVIEHDNFSDAKTSVQKIILHRTAGGTTEACIRAFKSGRKNKSGGIDHYGTHFIVGKDGIITQTANLNKKTWHCKGWNSKSVGIEVVGYAIDKNGKPTLGLKGQNPVAGWENLTDKQAKSVACLVKALLNYYDLDKTNIDCHEHLAAKEEGEGQIVYNAIKDYL